MCIKYSLKKCRENNLTLENISKLIITVLSKNPVEHIIPEVFMGDPKHEILQWSQNMNENHSVN